MMKLGFDNDLYVKIQSEKIRERFGLFDKLYLEIGGKLFEDTHAARVLPGFDPGYAPGQEQGLRHRYAGVQHPGVCGQSGCRRNRRRLGLAGRERLRRIPVLQYGKTL